MTKSRQGVRARVSQALGKRRKKPTRAERAVSGVTQMVSGAGDRLFSRSGRSQAATKQGSAKKTAAARKRRGQQRQTAAKEVGAARIRSGRQRQAEAKKAARKRRVKTS